VAHQRCQLHFLNNLAEPAMEVDARLRQHLRTELRGLAAVPEETQVAPPPPADGPSTPPLCLPHAMPN
jgi:hypothetical protein